eukprot:SAG11_NODE_85_length_17370_cov_29.272017_4_plen_111_part_00
MDGTLTTCQGNHESIQPPHCTTAPKHHSDAGGGFAAGADSCGALEDPTFAEEAGEEEEEMWIRALQALEEDEKLELERAELDELMSERASLHTIPDDLELDKHACENTQK